MRKWGTMVGKGSHHVWPYRAGRAYSDLSHHWADHGCFPHTVDWSGWQKENVGLCGRRQLTRWGIKRIAERKLVQNEAVEKGRKPLDYDRARQRNNNEQLSALSHQMTAGTAIPNQSNLTRSLHFSISNRRYEKLGKLLDFHRISLVWFVI